MSAGTLVYGATTPSFEADPFATRGRAPHRESFPKPASSETLAGDVTPSFDVNPWFGSSLQRLAELGRLREDWDSYGSTTPPQWLLSIARELIGAVQPEIVDEPKIVPVTGGGVALLWNHGARELQIEILPTGGIEYLRADENLRGPEAVLEERVTSAELLPVKSLVRWVMT